MFYGQPLFLVPGINFKGVVKVYGGGEQPNGEMHQPNRMRIEFDLDSIEKYIDEWDVYANCTCSFADDDPDDCSCGLVAVEYRLRQDVHHTFTLLDDMFLKDALVEMQIVAGRFRPTFDTINRHSVFDCSCDNFRSNINFAFDATTMNSPFFDTETETDDDEDSFHMSSDFVDR